MKRLIAGAVFFLAIALPGQADVIHVPGEYLYIHDAVQAADSGDVVIVDGGTYGDVTHQPPDDTTYCAVLMKTGVTVRGSGQGVTIVDADSVGRAFHCGAVTDVTIRDMTIRHCFAELYGAAVFSTDLADVAMINLTIENCWDGGIIAIDTSHVVIRNCILQNTQAKVGGGSQVESGSSVEMYGCTLTGNSAPDGGGMILRTSTLIMDNCIVSNNEISAENGSGGGMSIRNNAQATITNSVFENNTADGSGGGLAIIDGCSVTMTECLIKGNRTLADYGPGGGIYCDFSSLELDDCTIVRNVVNGEESDGGGIYTFFGDPMTIHQCTIAANENHGIYAFGGGIGVQYASPVIEKTIIAFNDPGDGIFCTYESDNPTVSCSDIFGNAGADTICGTDAGNNFYLNPLFCDLANDNYRIELNSPCAPGNHPNGPWACQNQRIGGEDPGCDPVAVEDPAVAPRANWLLANRPNPFHPSTTIYFELAGPGHTVLRIFDVAGREITTLENRPLAAGRHQSSWNGRNDEGNIVPSGVYFYQLNVDGAKQTRHMVLSR